MESFILQIKHAQNYFSLTFQISETVKFERYDQALRSAYALTALLLISRPNLKIIIWDNKKEIDSFVSSAAQILRENNVWHLPARRTFPNPKLMTLEKCQELLDSRLFADLPGYSGFRYHLIGIYAERRVENLASQIPEIKSVRRASQKEDSIEKIDLIFLFQNDTEIKIQVKCKCNNAKFRNKAGLGKDLKSNNIYLLRVRWNDSDQKVIEKISRLLFKIKNESINNIHG